MPDSHTASPRRLPTVILVPGVATFVGHALPHHRLRQRLTDRIRHTALGATARSGGVCRRQRVQQPYRHSCARIGVCNGEQQP
eukprot:scaffold14670_cov108-Isochrysis_galbana.AAC.3